MTGKYHHRPGRIPLPCWYCPAKKEAIMAVLELTADTFNDAIAADKTVIIDFWAPWCGPAAALPHV